MQILKMDAISFTRFGQHGHAVWNEETDRSN
jgi:hypothetical protein